MSRGGCRNCKCVLYYFSFLGQIIDNYGNIKSHHPSCTPLLLGTLSLDYSLISMRICLDLPDGGPVYFTLLGTLLNNVENPNNLRIKLTWTGRLKTKTIVNETGKVNNIIVYYNKQVQRTKLGTYHINQMNVNITLTENIQVCHITKLSLFIFD